MSYLDKGDKEYDATGAPLPPTKTHKLRVTMTSSNVKKLETRLYFLAPVFGIHPLICFAVSIDIINRAKDANLRVKGPVRLPTKVLKITARKSVRIQSLYTRYLNSTCDCSLVARVPKPGTIMSSRSINVLLTYTPLMIMP